MYSVLIPDELLVLKLTTAVDELLILAAERITTFDSKVSNVLGISASVSSNGNTSPSSFIVVTSCPLLRISSALVVSL